MKKIKIKSKLKIIIPIIVILALLITIGTGLALANNNKIEYEDAAVSLVETSIQIEETIEQALPRVKTTVYTTTGVNMRNAPSLDGEIIKVLYINTELTKVGEENGWTIVEVDGQDYYVKSDYISTQKTEIKKTQVTTRSKTETRDFNKPAAAGDLIGYYKLTYYCSCSKCCGKSNGVTASGKSCQEGVTIACNSLPLGTKVVIQGHTYEVQDRGGMASNVIDIYVSSHQKALNLGVKKNIPVYKGE